MTALLMSIPSPSSGTLHLGPLKLNAYGLMIALGVVAAVWLMGKRADARKVTTRDEIANMAMWAVPAGVIGARLYHVATDWSRFSDNPIDIVKIWQGGLGIWGGIALGAIVGVTYFKRRGVSVAMILTCAAPALPLAQSIGRWGNWWNQELFGKPVNLPWALEVSDNTAIKAGYLPGTTFHPTFLYESLGCLAICGALILIDRRFRLRPGMLFAVYVAMYTFMRFFIEGLRIDDAHHAGGLRLNQWTSIVVFAISIFILLFSSLRGNQVSDVVLLTKPEPGVALLTLNRPDRMNAWNFELSERYFELLEQCADDPEVVAIVVTGAGRGFCAGADMDALTAIGANPKGGAAAAAGTKEQMITTTIPKPVIAAINGACAGLGLAQALMCDIKFAASGAKFTMAFSRRGLIAEYGLSWVAPRLGGVANAMDILLSSRVFTAEEAYEMGLINKVMPLEELVPYAIAYAKDLADNACPTSMAIIKQQVYADANRDLRTSTDEAVKLMKESLLRPDFKEGVDSFLEKRPPKFAPFKRK